MKYDDSDYLINREESIEYKNVTDENVGNIEEAIKRLKKMIKKCDECKFATCEQCEINWTDVESIRIVLFNFEILYDMQKMADIELKNKNRINEEHKKENRELRERAKELIKEKQELTSALLDSIPIQKIKDKIEELKLSGGNDGRDIDENLVRELAIEILEELLQESEEK